MDGPALVDSSERELQALGTRTRWVIPARRPLRQENSTSVGRDDYGE